MSINYYFHVHFMFVIIFKLQRAEQIRVETKFSFFPIKLEVSFYGSVINTLYL